MFINASEEEMGDIARFFLKGHRHPALSTPALRSMNERREAGARLNAPSFHLWEEGGGRECRESNLRASALLCGKDLV